MSEFKIKTFDLDNLSVRAERSKYPYEDLEVGQGFLFNGKGPSISGNVSARNKKDDKMFITRQTTNPEDGASKESPKTWVIRVK